MDVRPPLPEGPNVVDKDSTDYTHRVKDSTCLSLRRSGVRESLLDYYLKFKEK